MAPISIKEYEAQVAATRERRMKWWREARFGMFIHWGLYAVHGRNEWAMGIEATPVEEYEKYTEQFKPKPRCMRDWARVARDAGMGYMVMTAKHHEGFCLWDSQWTDYNAAKRGPKRDLVAEFVDACREFKLRPGLYYSLVDWHEPDCDMAESDPDARKRFLEFTHGCVRELMSNYGKIDILWYDLSLPWHQHSGWDSLQMNQMVRALQPDILINDRALLAEDFSTPEGHIKAAEGARGWESCMTMNGSWGYAPTRPEESTSARGVIGMIQGVAAGNGNLLLNVGPNAEGAIAPEAQHSLRTAGKWIARNREAIFGKMDRPECKSTTAVGGYTRRGNTYYLWMRNWYTPEVPIGGWMTKLKKASFLDGGKPIAFEQNGPRIVLKGLPKASPDKIAGINVIKLEFADRPVHKFLPTKLCMRDIQ